MDASELCQRLLDHLVKELPGERDAALGLAALLTFHPHEVRLFVLEVTALLMRNGRSVPDHLMAEISRRIGAPPPSHVG